MDNPHIQKAIEQAGGQAALARLICAAPAFVYQWRTNRRRVPAEHCPAIERATAGAVRCEDLRPDVDWAYLRGTPPDPADHHPPHRQCGCAACAPSFADETQQEAA